MLIFDLSLVHPQLYPGPAYIQNFAGKRASQGIVAPGSTRTFVPLQSNLNRSSLPRSPVAVAANIFSIPVNAPSSAAVVVSLSGSLFGAQDFSARLRVGVTASEASTWLSHSSLACKISAGLSKTESTVVTILSRLVSDPVTASISYNSGCISMMLRKNSPSTGSASVTLYGSNIGLASYSHAEVTGHTAAERTTWISDTATSSNVAHGIQRSLFNVLTLGSHSGSISNTFSFQIPILRGYCRDLDFQPCAEGSQTTVFAGGKVFGCHGGNISSASCSPGFKLCSGPVEVARLGVKFAAQSGSVQDLVFFETRNCSSDSGNIPAV